MTSRTVTYEFTARQSLTQAFQQTQASVHATGQAMGTLSQRISSTVSDQDRLKVSVRETGNEYTRLRDAANAYAAQQRAIAAEARAIKAQQGGGSGSGFLGGVLGGITGFVGSQVLSSAVGTIKDLSGQALQLAGNLEMTRGAFTSLLGSAAAADAQIADLKAFSDKAPLFDTANTQHFAQLLAGAGEQARRLVPDLKEIGAVTAGTGGGPQQLESIALAYSQVLTQGKLAGQEALQFANANVPIWRIIAEGIGTTTAQAKELSQEGKITSDIFQQAFSAYAVNHFADALVNAGDSLQGLQAQLQSGWQNALTAFGQGLEAGVKPILKDVIATLQDPRTLDQIRQWGVAAGEFVGQLWEGAKVVASWAGLDLPAVPAAPDYSALKLDTAAVSTNVQTSAASVTDFSREINAAHAQVEKLRDAQAAANAADTNRVNAIRDATTGQDRAYQRQIEKLRDAGTQLERNYQTQKAAKDLAEAQADLADDRRLAGNIFSDTGRAARERLLADQRRVGDLQDQIAYNGARAANQDAITGVERQKQAYDQQQQDRITGIERERTAREQANAQAIRDLDATADAYAKLQKALATPDPGIKAASDAYRAAYDSAFQGVQADNAQSTTAAISVQTQQYQQFYSGTLPVVAAGGRPLIFQALFGTAEEQTRAGQEIGGRIMGGITQALDAAAEQNSNFKLLRDVIKGDWAAVLQDSPNKDGPRLPAWAGGGTPADVNRTTGDINAKINQFVQNSPFAFLNSLFGGGSRDTGGPVLPGGVYDIGGAPETLIMGRNSGYVIPRGGKMQQLGPRNNLYYAAEGGAPPPFGGTMTSTMTAQRGGNTYIFNIAGAVGDPHYLAQYLLEILGTYGLGQGVA